MSSHPEIPKDHPRFSNEGKWTRFQTFDESDDPYDNPRLIEFVLIERLTGLQRQDCAAHAAAWWFERAAETPDWDEHSVFAFNALAWLKWGAE